MMAGRSAQQHNFNNQVNNNFPTKKTQGQNSHGRRMRLVCDYCGYKGHTRESCYTIVGIPANFKSKRKGYGGDILKVFTAFGGDILKVFVGT